MNTVLIALGLIFLLNPVVWIWDVMPDFIGAFLIMLGMRKIVLLSEDTENLWRRMWRIAIISAAKVSLSFLLVGAEGGVKLITSLVFTSLELIFLLPAVTGTVGLCEKLQERFLDETVPHPDSRLPSLMVFLSVYTVIRLIVGFLPEIAELISTGRFGNVISGDGKYYPSDSKWMLYVVAAALTAVFFVVAFIMTVKAYKRYGQDKMTPVSATETAEADRALDVTYWNARRWKLVRTPFIAAALLCIYLFIDGIDFFPKIIGAAVICALTVMHSNSVLERALAVVGAAALGATSLIANSRLSDFFMEYNSEQAVLWSDSAKSLYTTITVLIIIEAALTFALTLLMTELIIRRRVGEIGEKTKMVKKFKLQMLALRIASFLAMCALAAYPFLRIYSPTFAVPAVIATGSLVFALSIFVDFDHARDDGERADAVVKAVNMDRVWNKNATFYGINGYEENN